MKNYLDLYIGQLAAEEKSPETLAQYHGQLLRLEKWLKEQHGIDLTTGIHDVNGLILTEYYQSLFKRDLAVSTRNAYVVAIKEFFEFMLGIGAIASNPSTVLRCVKEKKTPESYEEHRYTLDQIKELLYALENSKPRRNNQRDTAVVALILASAMRASEICSLDGFQMPQILDGTVLCKRKGGNWKKVVIGSYAIPYLEKYLLIRGQPQDNEPIFLSQKGKRLSRIALWKSLSTKQLRADLPTGIHILRHTVLSAIDRDGGSALARDIGGHASVAVTNRYVHTSQEERKAAVDSMPFAKLLS